MQLILIKTKIDYPRVIFFLVEIYMYINVNLKGDQMQKK
jgi:hypothetical protein